MKHLFFIALLLTATLTSAQGLLPEERIKKEPSAQPVHQTKKYDSKGEYYEGLAIVKLNDKFGFIDKTGKEVIPAKYYYAEKFKDGLAKVGNVDGSSMYFGYIDKAGKEVIPIKYDNLNDFKNDLAIMRRFLDGDLKSGFVDKTGKEFILKYDKVYDFSEGLAIVKHNNKYGFIDKTGKEVTPIKYDYAVSFSEGLASVKLEGKWFYINPKGECVKNCDNAPADHPKAK